MTVEQTRTLTGVAGLDGILTGGLPAGHHFVIAEAQVPEKRIDLFDPILAIDSRMPRDQKHRRST